MALNFQLKALRTPPGIQCLTTLADVLAKSAQYLQVIGPAGTSFIVISETEPSVDDRDKVWLRLESNGKPYGLFKFQTTEWILIPGVHKGAIMLYSGAVADIPDGWHLADGLAGTPDLTDSTDFASLWEPNYTAPGATYTLAPIYFLGLQS